MTFLKKYIFYIFILFSIYVAIIIGETWDESYHYEIGKITFNYIFSFGQINKDLFYREVYSPLLWMVQYFISLIFPINYKTEVMHVINLFFALTAAFGLKKITKILFNSRVSEYSFVLLLFYPVFFGHMSINSKDIFLASCHVWILYYVLKYLRHPNLIRPIVLKLKISVLLAIGTGIQLLFVGSLIPIILLLFFDAFFFKKILKKEIIFKNFLIDFLIVFITFYLILILFWIDTHSNIFTNPFKFISFMFSDEFKTGWSFNNLNGFYFNSTDAPINYFFLLLFFKSPEFFIFLYILFFYFFITENKKFGIRYESFNYKLTFVFFIISLPTLIIYFIPFPIYDGLRLFMWTIPYIMIPPAIFLNYLNLKKKINKFLIIAIALIFTFYFYNFIKITPYQYTYLNLFAGNKSQVYQRFVNDYWGASLKELIKNLKINKNTYLSISLCGVSKKLVERLLIKNNFSNFEFNTYDNSEYVIMTNRTLKTAEHLYTITNCFDFLKGEDQTYVKRNDVMLSTFRKIN